MDAVENVQKEIDKVISKFSSISNHSSRILSDVIAFIEKLKYTIEESPPDSEVTPGQVVLLKEALANAKEKLTRLATDHRDLHGTVSKVGKAVDRNFVPEFTATTRSDLLQSEKNLHMLNKIIAQHFYRQGMDDVADTLVKESGLPVEEILSEPYAELHRIFEEINKHNLQPALDWANQHSAELEHKNSSLEFKLHRLAYLQILVNSEISQAEASQQAILYARNHFEKFVFKFEKDIQILMGCLIYLQNGIDNSPYKYLLASEMWIEAADCFIKDACNILGINKDSPLAVIVNSGCLALPALLNLKQVMLSRQVQGIWSGRDELPIEIDLDPENRYHSIFACPILRQQSTENNPPMRLKCGHVISRDALNKLSNGSISTPILMESVNTIFRLKCPYCPMEQSVNDAKLISF